MINPGKIIVFGRYPQASPNAAEKEPIEWIVFWTAGPIIKPRKW